MYSNADPLRRGLFEKISKYKIVASDGRYMNNIGLRGGQITYSFRKSISSVLHVKIAVIQVIQQKNLRNLLRHKRFLYIGEILGLKEFLMRKLLFA